MPPPKHSPTPTNTVRVKDCLPKLKFLSANRTAAERGGYATNWKSFASRIADCRGKKGLSAPENAENYRNSLESTAKNDKIDADNEGIICELCRIDVNSTVWRDGTIEEFKKDYEGAQFVRVRLGGWSIAPEVSVGLSFSPQRAAATWPCDIEIGCQPAKIEEVGQSITITRAKLELAWDRAKFPETAVSGLAEREDAIAALTKAFAAKKVSCYPFGGDQAPGWWFENVEGLRLAIISVETACALSAIAHDLVVDARLIVEDRDLRAVDAASNVTVQDEDGEPIRRRDGKPLGENKKKVLQAITVRSLQRESGQDPGKAVLAIDRVQFKKK